MSHITISNRSDSRIKVKVTVDTGGSPSFYDLQARQSDKWARSGPEVVFILHEATNKLYTFYGVPGQTIDFYPTEASPIPSDYVSGSNPLQVGSYYVFYIMGSTRVFTVEGSSVRTRPYVPGNKAQIFKCVKNDSGQLGLVSASTGKYLGRSNGAELVCSVDWVKGWELFRLDWIAGYGQYALFWNAGDGYKALQETQPTTQAGGILRPEANATPILVRQVSI